MTKQPRPWNRRLWGVAFSGSDPRDPPILIGTAHDYRERRVPWSEPTRTLLFNTRQEAREWCSIRMETWSRGDGITKRWRVRPVAVREIVEVI